MRGISSEYGMSSGMQARMPRISIVPSPGKSRSSRAVRMIASIVDGHCCSASHTCAKRNHSRGSRARSSQLEFDRAMCSMSISMAALGRSTARSTRVASARLPVSVQCGNSRFTKMPRGFARSHRRANRSIARSRLGSGSWAMTFVAPSSAVALSSATKSSGPSLGSMRKSSTSSTSTPLSSSRALVSFMRARSRARSCSGSAAVTRVMRRLA